MTTGDQNIPGQGDAADDMSPLHNASLQDRLHKALGDVERAEGELAAVRIQLDITRDQMRTLRRSRAWRVTAPIRRLKRRLTGGDAW